LYNYEGRDSQVLRQYRSVFFSVFNALSRELDAYFDGKRAEETLREKGNVLYHETLRH
jgi:hypothetical protein